MDLILQVVAAIVIATISYWWYKLKVLERKLKWIPRIPGLPIVGNALDFGKTTDTLNVIKRYMDKAGGLFIIDLAIRNMVVATDHNFLKFLLNSTTMVNKSLEYGFLKRWLGSGLLTAKSSRWRKNRRIILPAFHFTILEQFIPIFESNGCILVDKLREESKADSFDIYPFVTLCALDTICETTMGVSIKAQMETHSDYIFAVKEMSRITVDRGFSPLKTSDLMYPLTKDFYKELKYLKILHSYTNSVIHSRRVELETTNKKTDDEGNDVGAKEKMAFLDLLLQATIDGEPLSDEMIREEVDTFLFAGHDTTSSGITFTIYCLANHPEVQAKAVEEQREIFGKDRHRNATYSDLQEMRYLDMVIKESLRLYPPVPFYGREMDTDIEYKEGQFLPKDTTITIFAYGVHRDPKVFPDPERFDPTRFQDGGGISQYSYIPFSAGPRNCIGQKLAMLEMKSTISKLLRNYEILQATPKHNIILAAETVLKSANGVRIKIRDRDWETE